MRLSGSISTIAASFFFICLGIDNGANISGESVDQTIRVTKSKIRQLISKKKDTLQVIEKMKNNEYKILDVLTRINADIQISKRRVQVLKIQINALHDMIHVTKNKIDIYQNRIKADMLSIDRQIKALFYLKKVFHLTPLLGMSTFEHFFRNRWILQKNAVLNFKRVQQHEKNVTLHQQEEVNLKKQLKKRSKLAAREREQSDLLSFEKQQQATYLQYIRKDRTLRIKYLQEIQVEVEKLNDIIYSAEIQQKREKRSKTFGGFRNLEGMLPPPVKGEIASSLKNMSTSRQNLFKRGILIEADDNQEVLSILEGKVVFAGPFRGYKRLIILDHGRGSFSIYGNLRELFVQVGEIVDAQVGLGVVGFDAESEKYLFYFETRRNRKSVNPLQWFKKDVWK